MCVRHGDEYGRGGESQDIKDKEKIANVKVPICVGGEMKDNNVCVLYCAVLCGNVI